MTRFGVEVEFGGNPNDVIRELRAEGLAQADYVQSYMGHDNNWWIVKRDASVSRGGELVGPPLDFENPEHREQLTKAIKCLQRAGATTDPTAGIHIHIESRGMDGRQLSAIARLFAKYEDILYRLASSGWRTLRSGARQYAKPLTEEQKKRLATARTEEGVKRAYYGSSRGWYRESSHGNPARYCGLNLHSHFYRGTIEFRIFNSSLNPDRIQTYLAVCAAMMKDARSGTLRSINSSTKLGDMKAGRADADKVFFNFLSVMRYQAEMSLEDYRNLKKFWEDSEPQEDIFTGSARRY